MPWTERQRALLEGMGLRLWSLPRPVTPVRTATASFAATASSTPTATATATVVPATAVAAPAAAARPVRPPIPAPMQALSAPADPAGLDWPALREAVATCRACGLCEARTQTVFGAGSEQAHWMVVGEAPGEQEDREGQPFVGPAGQLLDRMLAALQLTRATDGPAPPAQRVYIANTLKCRPPRNRNPDADELARCAPFLARQIELLRPRLILAMGRYAVRSLLASEEPLGRLRGRVHRWQSLPVVVTYHPAYLLRNPADKARAWEDLCLAAQVAQEAQEAQEAQQAP